MINKVYEMLQACNVPLSYISRPSFNEKGIVISYHFFGEGGEVFEEGEEVETSGTLQIDLFAKENVDFTTIKKQIKELLKINGFLGPSSYDTQENTDGIGLINHLVITSNYLESEALGNG
ncbi:hypothetical protein CS063_13755 [Sporanaerobium hydrogeniformans]|uniref:Uncharacterized protein n=1 Tax=Sporanaerobium hydrogeniformans TaxID=3072179 RepID=A0AC61DAL1_9FIRM|nr:hypothetical protein [Sporanaerobium hydrogeniformans]PHV69778.1 hypothetical protein CS063_13755 [Sporanaerobium hydrogeniformans]